MLTLLITYFLVAHFALVCLCIRLWRALQVERAAAANLRWMEQQRRLRAAGLVKVEDWPEVING